MKKLKKGLYIGRRFQIVLGCTDLEIMPVQAPLTLLRTGVLTLAQIKPDFPLEQPCVVSSTIEVLNLFGRTVPNKEKALKELATVLKDFATVVNLKVILPKDFQVDHRGEYYCNGELPYIEEVRFY